jgi:hypothetical protein
MAVTILPAEAGTEHPRLERRVLDITAGRGAPALEVAETRCGAAWNSVPFSIERRSGFRAFSSSASVS